MSDFGLDIDGIELQQERLEREVEQWDDADAVFVGTAVEYAVYLEFGTSKMDPKPFFRPVINDARLATREFIRENSRTTLSEIDSADELVRVLALAVERRVKEIITEKGLIDTGTLRASIVAVPGGPQALPDADDLPDGDGVSPSAGRDAVSEAVEL